MQLFHSLKNTFAYAKTFLQAVLYIYIYSIQQYIHIYSIYMYFKLTGYLMTFVIVMGFHQIIVVMNDVKWHTYKPVKFMCIKRDQ